MAKPKKIKSKQTPPKWISYFIQGLMVFLGVFLGFFSDNYKHKLQERKIEKRNLSSYISNLQIDIQHLSESRDSCLNWVNKMEELLAVKGEFTEPSFQKQFFHYAIQLKLTDDYTPNESAFHQMQSTNTFRLIQKPQVLDSILRYQAFNNLILNQQDFVSDNFISRTESLMEITDLRDIPDLKFNGNKKGMHLYLNHLFVESVALRSYIQLLEEQSTRAQNIIDFIQKEYRLE